MDASNIEVFPPAEMYLDALLLEAQKLYKQKEAEQRLRPLDTIQRDNLIAIVNQLRPFCYGVGLSAEEGESIGMMIVSASECTYSYMRHNQIVGLANLLVALSLR